MKDEDINSAFLWPSAAELKRSGAILVGSTLYKPDALLSRMEQLITGGFAWAPITGSTKRTESPEKLSQWITEQLASKQVVDLALGRSQNATLDLDDFPDDVSGSGNKVISTARNIAYLVDGTALFLRAISDAFGIGVGLKARALLDTEIGVFLYVTNSIESGGRAFFGDPFTGQATAYSRIFAFDMFGKRVRNFVAYYPHQLYSQCFTRAGKMPQNKGARLLASQATMLITASGVLIDPTTWSLV